jgi:hypothetical protein
MILLPAAEPAVAHHFPSCSFDSQKTGGSPMGQGQNVIANDDGAL